jgi:hypothetical protein
MHRPAWTRRTRIQRLNQNVLFHLPRWIVQDVTVLHDWKTFAEPIADHTNGSEA